MQHCARVQMHPALNKLMRCSIMRKPPFRVSLLGEFAPSLSLHQVSACAVSCVCSVHGTMHFIHHVPYTCNLIDSQPGKVSMRMCYGHKFLARKDSLSRSVSLELARSALRPSRFRRLRVVHRENRVTAAQTLRSALHARAHPRFALCTASRASCMCLAAQYSILCRAQL